MAAQEGAQGWDRHDDALNGLKCGRVSRAHAVAESRHLSQQISGSKQREHHLGSFRGRLVDFDRAAQQDRGAVGGVAGANEHLTALPPPGPPGAEQLVTLGVEQ